MSTEEQQEAWAKHRKGSVSMNKYPGAPRPTWRRCPPHTPLKAVRNPAGGCVVECLGCGKRGPERQTPEAARADFFESE